MKRLLFINIFLWQIVNLFAQISETKPFTICDEKNIYSVDNYQLRAVLKDIKEPKSTPEYEGGTLEIRRYFDKITLDHSENSEQVFRSYISFIVNCEGQVGNYNILGNQPDSLRVLEEKIIEKLKKMPNLWSIAENKGNKVDCYQVLVFTVLNGTFTNIFYK
ncbi:MAG TPA: hypothetical protein DDX39_03810 [Bacteroidales bacterium]|nr:MAG: hypothetical protein A2W98_08970 [Bacteroidetes bacterium GWF2_33_38]OFY72747.1 MAG: hypothetical protein A2265_01770 [Bacteroidetes bacterium RIFOXYA12_FULL_33_9]OFY90127.1 MAG: hypothetical protein A2236_10130 [Bacteroidetes bacterium RIFOXYA2_FULL_33_7]HBF87747.1 hypothetical protein [Bacteroidales bacterium]